VSEAHPPVLDTARELGANFGARWCVNARMSLLAMGALIGRELTADDVEPATWAMSAIGEQIRAVDFAKSLAAGVQLTRALGQWWAEGWDLLLTPTLGGRRLDSASSAVPRTIRWPVHVRRRHWCRSPPTST
jgi:amidase